VVDLGATATGCGTDAELRIAVADATGEGVGLRMAAARAALGRLADATPGWADRPPADLVVATGGAWAVAPAPVVALALSMSCVAPAWPSTPTTTPGSWRRSGRSRIRSNGRPIADLADDLLAPLGTVVTRPGCAPGARWLARRPRRGRGHPGRLLPGGLSVVDLPPGRRRGRIPVPRHRPPGRAGTSRST
jgi:hypothetical protein